MLKCAVSVVCTIVELAATNPWLVPDPSAGEVNVPSPTSKSARMTRAACTGIAAVAKAQANAIPRRIFFIRVAVLLEDFANESGNRLVVPSRAHEKNMSACGAPFAV